MNNVCDDFWKAFIILINIICCHLTIYYMNIAKKFILGTFAAGFAFAGAEEQEKCFIYRDDIGAFWGIKGYE
jgi:uncharacterized membrane protein HdeD (DUF308 family)